MNFQTAVYLIRVEGALPCGRAGCPSSWQCEFEFKYDKTVRCPEAKGGYALVGAEFDPSPNITVSCDINDHKPIAIIDDAKVQVFCVYKKQGGDSGESPALIRRRPTGIVRANPIDIVNSWAKCTSSSGEIWEWNPLQ